MVWRSPQTNVALIVMFNYFYTFIQLEPSELSEQLKRQGASIPAVRPGKATSQYITRTLTRMSILGSAFLGVLAAAPTVSPFPLPPSLSVKIPMWLEDSSPFLPLVVPSRRGLRGRCC